jgi:flagellar biosynthesis anti-sigma factor FlgM
VKIHGNRPEYDQSIAGPVDTSRAGEVGGTQGAAPAAPTHGTDQVRVSSDAQLASAAIAAAEKAPDIRPEAVARGRALLNSGKLGADAESLADKLIDRGIES